MFLTGVIKAIDQRLGEGMEYLRGKIITEFSRFDPASCSYVKVFAASLHRSRLRAPVQ
jgi:hypothetical protein